MFNFRQLLNEKISFVLRHLESDINNRVFVSTTASGSNMFGVYLSLVKKGDGTKFYLTHSLSPIFEDVNHVCKVTSFNSINEEFVPESVAKKQIERAAIELIIEDLQEYGFRKEAVYWILNHKKMELLPPKEHWFGDWTKMTDEDMKLKPINLYHSKMLKELYRKGLYPEMALARIKENKRKEKSKQDVTNKLIQLLQKRFDVLSDTIGNYFQVLSTRTPTYNEYFIVNCKAKLVHVLREFEFSDNSIKEIDMTENIFMEIIAAHNNETIQRLKFEYFKSTYNPKSKVIEGSEKITYKEIVVEEDGIYMYYLNCYKARVVNLGDCECNEHPTYKKKLLTDKELEEYYVQTRSGTEVPFIHAT